jgi:hypothetical protein
MFDNITAAPTKRRAGTSMAVSILLHRAVIGLAVLGRRSFVGGASGLATASLVFLPLWLVGAGVNMYVGVKKAGYSVAEEAPILLVVFLIPAAAALAPWWTFR